MTPVQQLIDEVDSDLGLIHIEAHFHRARGTLYELQVSRVAESGQYRIYVLCNGHIQAYIFDPEHDRNSSSTTSTEKSIVLDLVNSAIHDIDENLDGLFDLT